MKLKEFNHKLLHGFVSCDVNLGKWTIRESCVCDVCDLPQTIDLIVLMLNYCGI